MSFIVALGNSDDIRPRPAMLHSLGRHTESVGRLSRSMFATRKTLSKAARQMDIELVVGLRHPDGGLGLGLVLNLERVTKQKNRNNLEVVDELHIETESNRAKRGR